jgi:hypothetical protein
MSEIIIPTEKSRKRRSDRIYSNQAQKQSAYRLRVKQKEENRRSKIRESLFERRFWSPIFQSCNVPDSKLEEFLTILKLQMNARKELFE